MESLRFAVRWPPQKIEPMCRRTYVADNGGLYPCALLKGHEGKRHALEGGQAVWEEGDAHDSTEAIRTVQVA